MWIIVSFEANNSLVAVPEFWFKDGFCEWPNKYSSKIIEHRNKPNDLEFSNFKAQILFENIDNAININ